jgi:hypothetical protein
MQMEQILKVSPRASAIFKGCYPLNEIPPISSITNFPSSIVVNFDPSTRPGTHWVAVYMINRTTAYYFDSLALEIPSEIKAFLNSFPIVLKNELSYQNPKNTTCALYSIFFILYMSNRHTFDQFTAILNRHLPFVDNFVIKMFGKMIG